MVIPMQTNWAGQTMTSRRGRSPSRESSRKTALTRFKPSRKPSFPTPLCAKQGLHPLLQLRSLVPEEARRRSPVLRRPVPVEHASHKRCTLGSFSCRPRTARLILRTQSMDALRADKPLTVLRTPQDAFDCGHHGHFRTSTRPGLRGSHARGEVPRF